MLFQIRYSNVNPCIQLSRQFFLFFYFFFFFHFFIFFIFLFSFFFLCGCVLDPNMLFIKVFVYSQPHPVLFTSPTTYILLPIFFCDPASAFTAFFYWILLFFTLYFSYVCFLYYTWVGWVVANIQL